ncbi:MAG: TRAP transporter large permease [Clostridiales bacterium]|nr:TRAP transporter large permease [Clostridiales bacterium]MCF8022044.1 TRAP transporter large permease [Clostridiales bacterium]
MTVLLLFGTLIVFMLLGVPIAVSVGLASVICVIYEGIPIIAVAQRMFTQTDSIILAAIPAFIIAGSVMSKGGLAKRLVSLCEILIARLTGGLSMVTILSAMFFSAISGSNVATTAAVGGIMVPEMNQRGYDKSYAASVAAAGGIMGVIIPPSLSMVIYGAISSTSIGALFVAGIPIGILMALSLLVVCYLVAKKRGYSGKKVSYTWKEFLVTFKDAFWALGTPVIMIGGILAGIFTPTEAAVIAVVYGALVSVFIYREMSFKELIKTILEGTMTSVLIMFIIANAAIFGWIVAAEQVPQTILNILLGISSNTFVILLIINIALLFAGFFMETAALLIICTPVLIPVAQQLGLSPIHFGIMMILNLGIGNLTPPLGVCLYTGAMISDTKVEDVSVNAIPFLIALLVILLLTTYIPSLTLWLPELLMPNVV